MFEDNFGYPACRPLPSNLAVEEPEFEGALEDALAAFLEHLPDPEMRTGREKRYYETARSYATHCAWYYYTPPPGGDLERAKIEIQLAVQDTLKDMRQQPGEESS